MLEINKYPSFEDFWDLYDKKVGKKKAQKKWNKLKQKEKEMIMENLPAYIYSTPNKQFRKNPETYLNNESWNDEIILPYNENRLTEEQRDYLIARTDI